MLRVLIAQRQASQTPVPKEKRELELAMRGNVDLCSEIMTNTQSAVEVLDDLLNYDKIEVGGLSLDLSFVADDR